MESNLITVTPESLEVEPTGINKYLGFKRKISVPLSEIKSVSVGYGILCDGGAWRELGTGLPRKKVGLYSENGVKAYVNVKHGEKPLLIELENNEYDQLVLGVTDPKPIINKLEALIGTSHSISHELKPEMNKAGSILLSSIIIAGIVAALSGIIGAILIGIFPKPAEILLEYVEPVFVVILIVLVITALVHTHRMGRRKKNEKQKN
ncbi:MAG: hypothetical protein LBV19_02760 [Streptococcaceae bacterium]|jgi:hypothetical protein|nr:hypothetical protein [Streptococcaceae bacterium]